MALSIHYSGTLTRPDLVPQLVNEVSEVCNILGWDQHISHDGILFGPPECEPLFFHFKTDGELVNNLYLQYNIEPANTVSVKTQYAGVEVHMAVVNLLRHLSKTYFKTFHLDDEGYYWETGDEAVLRQRFAVYNGLLDAVSDALQDFEAKPNEPGSILAERLEAFLSKRLGGDRKSDS